MSNKDKKNGEEKSELQKLNEQVKPEGPEQVGEFYKELMVTLNDQELLARGQRIALLASDLASLEAREESSKAAFKSERAKIEAEQDQVIRAIRNKAEVRQVPVKRFRDYGTGRMFEVRLDSKKDPSTPDYLCEEINSRPLTFEERQTALELKAEKRDDLFDQAQKAAEQMKKLGKDNSDADPA